VRVCLGGTFHPFHAGHKALLRAACEDADRLFIGVTDGKLARRDDRVIAPWEERADTVATFLAFIEFHGELEINRLEKTSGPAATGDYDAIVVSPETVAGANAINDARKGAALKTLQVRVVPHVLADDLLPISSTRIHSGSIDGKGRRLRPVTVAVGTQNPVKLEGVSRAFSRLMAGVHVVGCDVASGVPEQPSNRDMLAGAQNRANAAKACVPRADYWVGVEAGLNEDAHGNWYDMQTCIVVDATGKSTSGHGPAFHYPDWVTTRALDGEMISDILGPVAGDSNIGGTTGAIGFLTDGRYTRIEFTEQAVMMAFVPRIRPELYAAKSALI
jgi:inosine/xanthosine triphosphatase